VILKKIFFPKIPIMIVFLGIALSVNAQAPGYMGHQKIFSYDLYLFPTFFSPNYNGNSGITSFNFRHVLNFDFTTTIRQSIGISASYTRTKSVFTRSVEGIFGYEHNGYQIYVDELSLGNTMADLSVIGIGLNLKQFLFSDFIAPLGWYFKPEITIFILNSSYEPEEMKPNVYVAFANDHSYDDILLKYPSIPNNVTDITEAISIMFGRQSIYFNRFVFNIGLEIGYVFGGQKVTEILGGHSPTSIPEADYTQVMGKSRLCNVYFLNVVGGIGYLW
jgi:hypothetical protein